MCHYRGTSRFTITLEKLLVKSPLICLVHVTVVTGIESSSLLFYLSTLVQIRARPCTVNTTLMTVQQSIKLYGIYNSV